MYVQNSSQFSDKWKDHIFPFLIFFVFVIIVFFDTVFRHCHRKIDVLEMINQFTMQKKLIMLPDDVLSRI